MRHLGINIKKLLMGLAISLILNSCAKHNKDDKTHHDLGSGDKSNLPVSLTSLIEHAEYCKAIYDSGGNQKDEVAFEVKQVDGFLLHYKGAPCYI